MQEGIGLNDYEVKKLIKARVSELTGVATNKLKVDIAAGFDRVSAIAVHIDGKTNIKLKDGD